ncbi:MAG: hypothetical protein Q7S21_03530 [archaeon]|nr:hypothetical protein [archaeon]
MTDMQKWGSYAFIIGIIIAILAAFVAFPETALILVVLGLIVGLLNVTGKESVPFLVAAIALTLTASALQPLGTVGIIRDWILPIFNNIAVFVAPAAFIVAIKAIYSLAREA